MQFLARANTARATRPSDSTSPVPSARPHPWLTPTSTPPLSSTSLTSGESASSSSGPSTPPPSVLDARSSLAWSLVSGSGPADALPPASLGAKLRSRSRSKSRGRVPPGGDRDRDEGRVGRFFGRMASRKSLRGEADGRQDGPGGDDDDAKVPPMPGMPPKLELLQLPALGPAFELKESAASPASDRQGPKAGSVRGDSAEGEKDDLGSLLQLVNAAADKYGDDSTTDKVAPAPPKNAPSTLSSRLKRRLSRLSLSVSRPLSPESVDDYSKASDDDHDGHAWLSPPGARNASPSLVTPPTSPFYASSPSPRSSPYSPRSFEVDPTVERLYAHTRSRLAPSKIPVDAGAPLAPSSLPFPPPTSTHTPDALRSNAKHRRTQPLRTLLAHHQLRRKLQRGVTLVDRAELAQTSTAPPAPPPPPPQTTTSPTSPTLASLPQAPDQHQAHVQAQALAAASFPLPRLREWAARPSFAERALVHLPDGRGTDVVRPRVRSAAVAHTHSERLRSWLAVLELVQGASGWGTEPRGERPGPRPAREAPPRVGARARADGRGSARWSALPAGPWVELAPAEVDLSYPLAPPAPPASPSQRQTVVPGPLLRRAIARQDAEDALSGRRRADGQQQQRGADVQQEEEEEDEDERPLATLSRSPRRASYLPAPPMALSPPATAALAAEQRETARLEAELGRLRAREELRAAEEAKWAAQREREAREGKVRRRAEEQSRRTRAMLTPPATTPAGARDARRRSTAPASPAGIPHSASHGPYLAVPAHRWGLSTPTLALPMPMPLGVPLYHHPLHAISAPDLQRLQQQHQHQQLVRTASHQRDSFAAPSSGTGASLAAPRETRQDARAPAPLPPPRPQRNSLRPPPHPLPHSRSTPDIRVTPHPHPHPHPHARQSAVPLPPAQAQGRRASYRPQTPLVTVDGPAPRVAGGQARR
ncbi:hypothetical protein DMC30DRAFT_79931 [Rhodotorula diobovata]|uniref:Uncharacterized protein n=1 Tax=Rhodotorula diobovata TaxID=5288 RepID=A0A5C5FQG1_9BASI|nr:hypothetical protein DMC30DRAFT_79931 [Rhodotorula diobovata]